VHVEVDDSLIDRRLGRDVEAALYFVALEALTNSYKHARDASISVWLRADCETVRLDVVDTGPGLGDRPDGGSGLQNMHDRIAAVGGKLTVASQPGHGTHVSAAVRVTSTQVQVGQPVAADSRR